LNSVQTGLDAFHVFPSVYLVSAQPNGRYGNVL
jgi:hypothetical protein